MQFASMSISFFYSFTEMIEVLTDYTLSAVIILFILLVYFFIVGIRWYVKKMKMKKEEEDNPYE
jgi:flagellar biosynthesis protein FlhB